MIDSHCHLDHDPLFNNINEVLARSKSVGLKKLLTICTSNESFENIKKILDLDEIITAHTEFIHMKQKIIMLQKILL